MKKIPRLQRGATAGGEFEAEGVTRVRVCRSQTINTLLFLVLYVKKIPHQSRFVQN